jgi:hypothetical protein
MHLLVEEGGCVVASCAGAGFDGHVWCQVEPPEDRSNRWRGTTGSRPMSKGDIKESDWKVFKRLRELALERFCERVLEEISRIGSDNSKSKHERYVGIYRLVQERDREINPIFDHLRRSTAGRQVVALRSEDLLTEEEVRQFSPDFVKTVEGILDSYNRPMERVDEDLDPDDSAP